MQSDLQHEQSTGHWSSMSYGTGVGVWEGKVRNMLYMELCACL